MKQGHFKVITLAIVIVTTILVGVKTHTKQTMEQMSETMLQNIEALASGEGGTNCSNYCKEWSGTSGGGIACDCARYSGKCKNYC